MHVLGLDELALLDRSVRNVGEHGDDGAKHDAEELPQDRDGDRDGHGGLGAGAGEARERGRDDAAKHHVGRHRGADAHEAHAHELRGSADGETRHRVAQDDAHERGAHERLLEVQAAEQAANECVHVFLLSGTAPGLQPLRDVGARKRGGLLHIDLHAHVEKGVDIGLLGSIQEDG